jgi:hypothetical protein
MPAQEHDGLIDVLDASEGSVRHVHMGRTLRQRGCVEVPPAVDLLSISTSSASKVTNCDLRSSSLEPPTSRV